MHEWFSWMKARTVGVALAAGGATTLVPSVAHAHFTLDYPPSWTVDSDSSGTPQKAFPCGVLSTDTFMRSNVMTAFAPGQKVTVRWTEQVPHDGWFRISLSYKDGAEFQATTDFTEPPYEMNALQFSVDAGIENPVIPPVLLDGLDPHSGASVTVPKPYSQEITLPTKPCTKCVLQVIQIMLNHPINPPNNVPGAGYTYHHCAFISIEPGADGGTEVLPDAGSSNPGSGSSASGSSSGSGGSSGSGQSGNGGGSGNGGASGGGAGTTAGGDDASTPPPGAAGSGGSSGGGGGSSGGCDLSGTSGPGAVGIASLAAVAGLARRRRRSLRA
jgi:hypothetical protein